MLCVAIISTVFHHSSVFTRIDACQSTLNHLFKPMLLPIVYILRLKLYLARKRL